MVNNLYQLNRFEFWYMSLNLPTLLLFYHNIIIITHFHIHSCIGGVFYHREQNSHFLSWLFLVRYEDLARFPLQKTRELYNFLGLDLDHSVENWIINNTRGSRDLSSRQKFTTVRDSAANAENWRVKLSFDMVAFTQTACQPLLQLVGYKSVFHPKELRNFSHSLVEDRTFRPLF